MSGLERALSFDCRGERLVGILAGAESSSRVGVLIVVGGPQYRAGSHRQFVLLARRLAAQGVPTMRFDHRGMGDAAGPPPLFENIGPDIEAALEAMRTACPSVERVALWGLCDAASAALLYCQSNNDPRIAGLVLLNPWVRSEATAARTRLRHYYARRLFDRDFWTKVVRGRVAIFGAAREIAASVRAGSARVPREPGRTASTFQDRMADALRTFAGPILLILSGRDLTAREFEAYAASNARWSGLLDRPNVVRFDVPAADHTFSSARLRAEVEDRTLAWLRESFGAGPR